MPANESPWPDRDSISDRRPSTPMDCCREGNCDHQLQQLVLCYYGFRPFLDNAQVQLGENTSRATPPPEEPRSRRRPGRAQSGSASRGGGRGSRGRQPGGGERSSDSRSSTPTSRRAGSPWQTQNQVPVSDQTAQMASRGRGQGGQKHNKAPARPSPAAGLVGSGTPSSAGAGVSPATPSPRPPPLLPTPPSARRSVPAPARSLAPRSRTPRPRLISASDPTLHRTPSTPPQPPPPPPQQRATATPPGHLAAIFDRLSLLATPPGTLPAVVRVPPPSTDFAFCGSRSHGSLEVELGRCRVPRPHARRRSRSGGDALPEAEEVGGGAVWDEPACCCGVLGHTDSYDPGLDVPPSTEERSREQVRSERLLKNFDMFRDWDYVPVIPDSPHVEDRPPLHHRRAHSMDSSSDSDSIGLHGAAVPMAGRATRLMGRAGQEISNIMAVAMAVAVVHQAPPKIMRICYKYSSDFLFGQYLCCADSWISHSL